jgi:hypothetical protein
MPHIPTKATIAAEERGLLERQRVFRLVADRITAALARCEDVEAIALIGSVARPLWREVPRFAPYRGCKPKPAEFPNAFWINDLSYSATLARSASRSMGWRFPRNR